MSEHSEQAYLIQWARLVAVEFPELRWLTALPLGDERPPQAGARLKREGLLPGLPDLALFAPRRGWHGLFVELKQPGRAPSEVQRAWHGWLRGQGYRVEVAYGWQPAARAILDYLGASPDQVARLVGVGDPPRAA